MGYQKTVDLYAARAITTLAGIAARGSVLVRGVDSSDTTESATKGTDHGVNLKSIFAEVATTYLGVTQSHNAQTGTTYTLVLTDANKLVTLTNASSITLTVPPNSSVAFPTGTQIDLAQRGAGAVTVAAGSGVTVNVHADDTLVLDGQYAYATLVKIATNTWDLVGKLVAA